MGTLMNATAAMAIPFPLPLRKPIALAPPPPPLPLPLPLRCLRNNGDVNGLHEQRLEGSNNVDMSQSISDDDQNVKPDDIWQLFREAQQNILYLNKQRLVAIEELNKTNREKQSLLNKIEKLEAEKQASAGKDKLSICSELLLRIDSMVLTSMISAGEASELRSLVINHKVGVADVFNIIAHKGDSELLGELRHFSDGSKKDGFHIVHICSEMAPLVPRGSIASYVTGISRALQRKGHLVEVILPKYACLNLDEVQGLREVNAEAYSYFNGQLHGNKIWTGVVYGIGVTLIEPLYSSFFSRGMIYGYPDDFERFSYFSRASLDYIVKCGKQPDVLHLHNWETAIVGPLFWDIFVKQGLGSTRILLTCHGFNSQCIEQPDKLALCGLDPVRLHRPDRFQDNTNAQLVNILKGGVVYSNRVVIMSSIHPKHRIVHNLSQGLEPTLNVHRDKLAIAPYGLDKSTWDPSTDCFLPENFNAESMDGKTVCKVALQQRLGLSEHASITLVGCIFSEGADLDVKKVKDIILNAKQHNVQFIFLGTSERSVLNQALDSLQKELKDDNIKFVLTYDEALSHLVFAGSDIILCQSSLDPTDEIPLKALRYGAAPIAIGPNDSSNRAIPFDRNFINHDHEATKYSQLINSTFGNMSLSLAIDEIRSNPSKWKRRMMEAMAQMWRTMHECHQAQVLVSQQLSNLNDNQNTILNSESHHQATIQLETEASIWYNSFCKLVKSQREYVRTLCKWILRTNCLRDGQKGNDHSSMIRTICEQWEQGLDRLPDKEATDAINSLLSSIRCIIAQQAEEDNILKKLEKLERRLQKCLNSLAEMEKEIDWSVENDADIPVNMSPRHPLSIKRTKTEALKKQVESVKANYLDSVQCSRAKTLNYLKTGLPHVFQSLMAFSSASAQAVEVIHNPVKPVECSDIALEN